MPDHATIHAALKVLRQRIPEAAAQLSLNPGEADDHWRQTLDRKLLPRLNADFPLVAAICGGGSAGKSTLFNSLVNESVSPTGGKAGLNRRVLIGIHPRLQENDPLWKDLAHTFDAEPGPLENPDQLLTQGSPVYVTDASIPANLVLLDTPDIDTGAKGVYTNRDMARQCLEVADLFIYIFTNATYNNRDITDFISEMTTGMGRRPCFLVYRVYPGFSDDEVTSHADVVASNLYGSGASHHILGIYRADEDNAVAAGEAPMRLRQLSGGRKQLSAAIAALDTDAIRSRLMGSMMNDAVDQARKMRTAIVTASDRIEAYARALETVQGQCVQASLTHFPLDRVLGRFAQIWAQSDPAHIKIMRQTGRAVEWPLKTIIKTIRRFKPRTAPAAMSSLENTPVEKLEMDLISSSNQLYQKCMDDRLQVDGQTFTAPAVVHGAQARLRETAWQDTLKSILDQKTMVVSWSRQLDGELTALAHDLRRQMGWMDQVRQTFAAMLNVIPATAAITYILHTGDPAGAVGIKVKLTGLFGLHDLYALIAIPATAGMSKADRGQLEQLLGPLARAWLENKFRVIQTLLESHISGSMLELLRTARENTRSQLQEIDGALKTIE